eukprot:3501021-Rhodomonas_salina.5
MPRDTYAALQTDDRRSNLDDEGSVDDGDDGWETSSTAEEHHDTLPRCEFIQRTDGSILLFRSVLLPPCPISLFSVPRMNRNTSSPGSCP